MGAFNGGRGNWEIANSSSPLPSVHQLAGEGGKRLVAPWYPTWWKGHFGEERALLAFCGHGPLPLSVRGVRKDGGWRRSSFLATVDQDWEEEDVRRCKVKSSEKVRRCKVKKSKELIKIERGRSKKVRLRQFPPVSSNMLDGDKKAGGYVGGIYKPCKGPSQLLRQHRLEWNAGIQRLGKHWYGGAGVGGQVVNWTLGSSQGLTRRVDRDVAKALDNMVMRMYGG